MRTCLKSQIDAPGNKATLVSVIYDYCKCYTNSVADKISDDEVKTLEANGSDAKYKAALQSRAEAATKLCVDSIRKTLSPPH